MLPDVWGSLRVGFAFLGADAQNEAAKRDSSVSSFMPWLVEARAQYFPFRRVFAGTSRPFAHVTAGFAEETPQLDVQPPMETQTDARGGTPIRVTYAMGPFFAGGGLGCSIAVFGPVRLEAELSGFVAFPKSGWFARPSVGGSYDF